MRIVFMGSTSFSCRSLEALSSSRRHSVVGVVVQSDKPKGRQLKIASCPAKVMAVERGFAVFSPLHVNDPDSVACIRALAPDLIVVAAYGQILKQELLDLPPLGCVNVHASLLPKHRGAAPIQWAIARGDGVTGVTLMHMAKRMDAGDIISRKSVAIQADETGGSLQDKLAAAGAVLLGETLDAIAEGRAVRVPQDEGQATYAPKLTKEDGRIDWKWAASDLYNRIRAFNPWPCCFCAREQGILRILKAGIEESAGTAGEVLDASGDGPLVAVGDRSLRLLLVQPEGRKIMTGTAYLNGHALKKGDFLS